MHTLMQAGAAGILLVAAGLYGAAWMCHRRADRSGWWHHPYTGLAGGVFLIGSVPYLMMWISAGSAFGVGSVLARAGVSLVAIVLQIPLASYHIGEYLGKRLAGEGTPEAESDDEFERARSAEARGDARGAMERYRFILRDEPLRTDVRIRLAELLAGSRRVAQAREVVRDGLMRDDLPDGGRRELSALLVRWEEGRVGLEAPGGAGRGAREVTTVRMQAHEQAKAEPGDEDRPLPA